MDLKVVSPWPPSGDQPKAINEVYNLFMSGKKDVILNGATGTGKSATTAWIIEKINRPTLILAPNKVLAAQLAAELKELLPNNAVRFFVSHFAYYRPEAYVPTTDTFIEKDSSIDENIERLRHEATTALFTRNDTVIVSSVSALYGLGRPEEYRKRALKIDIGQELDRDNFIRDLVKLNYTRNDDILVRGKFRVRGEIIDIIPSDSELAMRIEFFGDIVESLSLLDPLSLTAVEKPPTILIFPQSHHIVNNEVMEYALKSIKNELDTELKKLKKKGKILEAERLKQRTNRDLEQIEISGTCKGIENYSRHFDMREKGTPPSTLIDYFPDDFLLVIDESHQTSPQIEAMYHGDQSRKSTLVEYGFRLPSALDNRPLKGEEFWSKVGKTLYLSATPGTRELSKAEGSVVDLVIRPTGLVDPIVTIKPNKDRLVDILSSIKIKKEKNYRTLVTTLTKKQSEQLNEYLIEQGIRSRYLHSEIDTVERIEILRELRNGNIDVIVGVNLLREGLDLPEVGLVIVLDADNEGFLRSKTSLIQTIGRAARNPFGEVYLYADKETTAIKEALEETNRRRNIQIKFNKDNNIVPQPLIKPIMKSLYSREEKVIKKVRENKSIVELIEEIELDIKNLTEEMKNLAKELRFEEASSIRDYIQDLSKELRELNEINN